jgi:hypothetical protein
MQQGNVHDCRILNDTIWAANILNQRVSIIDANNKDSLIEVRNFNSFKSMPHNIAITSDRKYLFLTHEHQNPAGRLEIFNIEDLENITFVRNWQPTGITTSGIHNIEIYGDSAYIAHYTAGIRILNITDPANPVEVAWYDTRPQDNSNTFDGCWAVYKFPSGKIIGSDITNGLFVIKTTLPTGIVNNEINPTGFTLHQNYPNPFNPFTLIRYSVIGNRFISLKVFNVQGKKIKTLINQRHNAGNYNIEFEGADHPSGIYFYKLESEGISEIKKMLMIK